MIKLDELVEVLIEGFLKNLTNIFGRTTYNSTVVLKKKEKKIGDYVMVKIGKLYFCNSTRKNNLIMNTKQVKQRFGIMGNSSKLERAIDVALQVAPTDISILVVGESGTGKESIPKIIHQIASENTTHTLQ